MQKGEVVDLYSRLTQDIYGSSQEIITWEDLQIAVLFRGPFQG
jgi:hypothetical protein